MGEQTLLLAFQTREGQCWVEVTLRRVETQDGGGGGWMNPPTCVLGKGGVVVDIVRRKGGGE